MNAKRPGRPAFAVNDIVWVLRSQPVSGNKLESWWLGPAKVLKRVGQSSYQVMHKPGEIWDVHIDFLKPYVQDTLLGTGVPLYFHKGTTKSSGLGDTDSDPVKFIRKHKIKDGKIEFLTRWQGADATEDTWEPAHAFVQKCSQKWLKYLIDNGLEVNLQSYLVQ